MKTNYKEILKRLNKQPGEVFFLETSITFMEDVALAEKVVKAGLAFIELKSYLMEKVQESKK